MGGAFRSTIRTAWNNREWDAGATQQVVSVDGHDGIRPSAPQVSTSPRLGGGVSAGRRVFPGVPHSPPARCHPIRKRGAAAFGYAVWRKEEKPLHNSDRYAISCVHAARRFTRFSTTPVLFLPELTRDRGLRKKECDAARSIAEKCVPQPRQKRYNMRISGDSTYATY